MIRDNLVFEPAGFGGFGVLAAVDEQGLASTVSIDSSVLDHNTEAALVLFDSSGTVSNTTIRDTQPNPTTLGGGKGIEIDSVDINAAPTLLVEHSVVSGSTSNGIAAQGANVAISDSIVKDTHAGVGEGRRRYWHSDHLHPRWPARCAQHQRRLG
ncbi:MAG: hypothetical protein U0165_03995 [Polyangiaceae bacterium]